MASTSDIRNGMVIEFKEGLFEVIEFLHVKPGKGQAFVRTKLKNVRTGQILENKFRTNEKLTEVRIEGSKMQYLYGDGTFFWFMNIETYEQISIPEATIGDLEKYLVENIEVTVRSTPEGEIVGVELPTSVVMEIVECEPNVKGNTASGSGKTALTNTGLSIMVPFFIEQGEIVRVDTRKGEYLERANK